MRRSSKPAAAPTSTGPASTGLDCAIAKGWLTRHCRYTATAATVANRRFISRFARYPTLHCYPRQVNYLLTFAERPTGDNKSAKALALDFEGNSALRPRTIVGFVGEVQSSDVCAAQGCARDGCLGRWRQPPATNQSS
jgi:hypothetical protein